MNCLKVIRIMDRLLLLSSASSTAFYFTSTHIIQSIFLHKYILKKMEYLYFKAIHLFLIYRLKFRSG